MRRDFLLRFLIPAVSVAMAYGLATAPLTGTDAVPTSARTGIPGTSAQQAIPVSADVHDATLLEEAFTSQATTLLGVRVLDLSGRDQESLMNVQISADEVDFTVLHPNEVFSFNRVVGIRTTERGYQSGLMYSNGQLVNGIGGGICITSTVLYNLALETGMKIIERHPHSGPVAYADPGRDSAVAYGAIDLQFKNNTGGVVLIRSIVSDDKLVVAFYGKKQPGREIEIATEDFEPIPFEVVEKEDATVPEGEMVVEQKGKPGHLASTVRIIRQDGMVVSRELISRDVVSPRNEVVLVHSALNQPGTPMGNALDLLQVPTYAPKYNPSDMLPAFPEPSPPGGNELPAPEQNPTAP